MARFDLSDGVAIDWPLLPNKPERHCPNGRPATAASPRTPFTPSPLRSMTPGMPSRNPAGSARHGPTGAGNFKSPAPTDFAGCKDRGHHAPRPKDLTIAIELGLNLQLHSAAAT